MKLPNAAFAEMPRAKVADYLLNPYHSDGWGKALFFNKFGFSARNWETLAEALHRHALENDVAAVTKTPFGTCYVIEGTLRSPDGRNPSIRTVWAQDDDEDLPPRLVTAYPISARKGNT